MRIARTFFEQLAVSLDRYVRYLVRYNTPDKKGSSKKDHLLKFRQQLEKTGASEEVLDKQFAELIEPEVPIAGRNVLTMFMELSSARQSGFNGLMPISYLELKAYADVTDTQFEPWEVDLIKVMDRALLEAVAEIADKEKS